MKHLLRPDYLQLLTYPNTLKPILRLNPSLLLISSKYTNLTHLYSIDNKRKTSKINSCNIYELDKYNKPNIKMEEWNTSIFQKDYQYKILDITDLDFNWNHFNPDTLVNKNKEYLDEIYTELNDMCKHFEIKEKLDGYHIKHGLFIFFN